MTTEVEPSIDVSASPLRTSTTIHQLAEALAKAQGAFPAIPKDKTARIVGKNAEGHRVEYTYNYADLADVIASTRGALAENALSVIQPIVNVNGAAVIVSRLLHSSGEWVESDFPLTISARPQDTGSALTYARRYALCALLNIAADQDDDGARANAAADDKPKRKAKSDKPADPLEAPRRALWVACQKRWGDLAEPKLHAMVETLGKTSTRELDAGQLSKLIDHANDVNYDIAVPPLWDRLRAKIAQEWKPSEADLKLTEHAAEERALLLGAIADLTEEHKLDDDGLRSLAEVKTPVYALALSTLREVTDRLSAWEQGSSPDGSAEDTGNDEPPLDPAPDGS